ncbi:hypothetical protein CMI47_14535 [Candidatus Pacearchaeota archaeon]|nr:hypothetical protein [Candidatus Pacearchaeota archaeon]
MIDQIMTVKKCDRCHLQFMEYIGWEVLPDEGVVCGYCIDEAAISADEEERYEKLLEKEDKK